MASLVSAAGVASVCVLSPAQLARARCVSHSSNLTFSASSHSCAPLRLKKAFVRPVVAMAAPEEAVAELEKITDLIDKAVHEAEDACKGDDQVECVAKWEEVEELSAARAHKKVQYEDSKDPLEQYCAQNPETDECRTYDD